MSGDLENTINIDAVRQRLALTLLLQGVVHRDPAPIAQAVKLYPGIRLKEKGQYTINACGCSLQRDIQMPAEDAQRVNILLQEMEEHQRLQREYSGKIASITRLDDYRYRRSKTQPL